MTSQHYAFLCAAALLAATWSGLMTARVDGAFTAHMITHMTVVAVAAPLLAFALSGTPLDPWRQGGGGAVAIAAAVTEFVVVWGWHSPLLHDLARVSAPVYTLEQASFLIAGLLVWLAAFGIDRGRQREPVNDPALAPRIRQASGIIGLLLTSMHMTLLGSLIALAPRPLYLCVGLCRSGSAVGPLEDQALGGIVMLGVGGVAYLTGGLLLLARLLQTDGHEGDVARTGVGR